MDEYNSDIESDLEAELEDLRRLTAALEDEGPGPSRGVSQISVNTSQSTFTSTVPDNFINIDTAIALNKLYDEKLQSFENMLIKRLNECRKRLAEVQNAGTLDSSDKPSSSYSSFRYINCGKPYFKDKYGFPAPENEDTILRAKAGMYDLSSIQAIPGWTIQDKNKFTKLILKMSQDSRKAELKTKLAEIQRCSNMKESKKAKQLSELKKKIDNVKKIMSLKEIALPINEDYDWDYIANTLNNRHKPQEYRGLWKLFLHPSINKAPWSKEEHAKLLKLVEENNSQDWETISKILNTDRSAYQCFVYYRTNVSNAFTLHKWTKDEEEYLKRLIDYYREDNYIPWAKIAASMENRTKIQIYNKYLRLVEQRKGRFLPEEDTVILSFAEKYGPDFKRMVWYLPGRSVTQCRVRYQVLSKKRVSIEWTVEEDRKLIQLMANQDSLKNYSIITKHFPGKDRVNIRSRYVTLEKWMMRHPNLDIDKAPRRAPRKLIRGNLTNNLNKAVENLKLRMESELEVNRSKVITMLSSEQKIEDAIIDVFVKDQIKMEDMNKNKIAVINNDETIQESNHRSDTQLVNETSLKQILILLKAKLNKDQFICSSVAKKYPNLLQPDVNIYVRKKKSYSKKENGVTLHPSNHVPDIWGNNRLGVLQYVLPPNYATITGCRKIMTYVDDISSDISNSKAISFEIKNNQILKDQMALLLERFQTLFIWPMILSNIPPSISAEDESVMEYQPPIKKQRIVYNNDDYALAMPKCIEDEVNDIIDLQQNGKSEDTTLEEKFDQFD